MLCCSNGSTSIVVVVVLMVPLIMVMLASHAIIFQSSCKYYCYLDFPHCESDYQHFYVGSYCYLPLTFHSVSLSNRIFAFESFPFVIFSPTHFPDNCLDLGSCCNTLLKGSTCLSFHTSQPFHIYHNSSKSLGDFITKSPRSHAIPAKAVLRRK